LLKVASVAVVGKVLVEELAASEALEMAALGALEMAALVVLVGVVLAQVLV